MRRIFFSVWLILAGYCVAAQTASYNFRRLSSRDGLSDGVVGPIVQDKYGYIWFGTLSGLNRYDGYRITNFYFNRNDSFSIPTDFVRTIHCDRYGNLWFGYGNGLYRFSYPEKHFELVEATRGLAVNEIRQADDSLCLLTDKGLAFFNTQTQHLSFASAFNSNILLKERLYEGHVYHSEVYIATRAGVLVYNNKSKQTRLLQMKPGQDLGVAKVVIDSSGTVWASRYDNGALLYKSRPGNTGFEEIRSFRYNHTGTYDRINDLYVDRSNRLWLGTIWNGLVWVNTSSNEYTPIVSDYRIPNSIPDNHITRIYMDKQGFIWLGTEGSGAASFQPDYSLFHIFFPDPLKYLRPHIWCRAIVEDREGDLWMGTGTGLVRADKKNNRSVLYSRNERAAQNALHSNSIRSLLCDGNNNIWIGTSAGVNLYERSSGKIKAFGIADSLPNYFYWTMMEDQRHTIWFGSTGGLYYKEQGSNRFYSLYHHPVLKAYAGYGTRSLLEDKKGNIWIGLNGKGLILYDTRTQRTTYWDLLGTSDNPLGTIITSIAEDKKGLIWFGSYYGLASYDYRTGHFTPYADLRMMESLQISGLQVDEEDRLWLATARGLLMLDKDRKTFKRFNVEDGLPDNQFNDQGAGLLRSGEFVYPTYDGFVSFDPMKYKEKDISSNIIISSFEISGDHSVRQLDATGKEQIRLGAGEDFFTIGLTAFNFSNPGETWYAYKLDGFDKDWIHTRNREANYTNVPGGNYLFRYKASSDPDNWSSEEKTMKISIGTVFYKTAVFRFGMVTLLLALVVLSYRYRLKQREKLMRLENKSQLLEKEKAQVMYENLKQQLNPHFLFNSLTSLSSLIRVNSRLAGEFLESLSKTYRYILKSRDSETVSLLSELKFAETYVHLQQTRFEKGLEVVFDVKEEHHHRKIVPVTLQNMIENAIKHNVIDEESPLVIRVYTEENHIIIENNLQRKNFVETSNRQGLHNLQSLYHYLSDARVQVEETGDSFMVKIPLL